MTVYVFWESMPVSGRVKLLPLIPQLTWMKVNGERSRRYTDDAVFSWLRVNCQWSTLNRLRLDLRVLYCPVLL